MGQAHFSSQYTTSNDLTTYSYTRTNGRGATESRITCKNCKDGVVTSLLTFCDGHGKCFSQEWGPHLGDEPGCGDNTDATGPPCDGFNCDDYSYLPNGWTEALIMTGYGRAVGNGLATVMRGGPAVRFSAGSFRTCDEPAGMGCCSQGCNSCGSSGCGGCNTGCATGCGANIGHGYGMGYNSSMGMESASTTTSAAATTSAPAAAKPTSNIELKPLGAQV